MFEIFYSCFEYLSFGIFHLRSKFAFPLEELTADHHGKFMIFFPYID